MDDKLTAIINLMLTHHEKGEDIIPELDQLEAYINNEKIAELETVAIYLDLPKGTKNGDTRTYVLDRIKELKNE